MKWLVLGGIALVSVVVVLGAYTRLVDAGLGCPDWPGCYGFISVPATPEDIAAAEALFPDSPVEQDKAWAEMVHRYFAASLGLLALVIWAVAWRRRMPLTIPIAFVVLVVAQGIFGAWTVTLKLWPQVVTVHLLGGFANARPIVGLRPQDRGDPFVPSAGAVQAACGGGDRDRRVAGCPRRGGHPRTTRLSRAPDFPACHGSLLPDMDFRAGFNLAQDVGPNYLGGKMTSDARVAIQMTHRLGAFIALFAVGWLAYRLTGPLRWTLAGVLVVQFGLGVANVLAQLPLAVATLHNAGAALLLLALITVYAGTIDASPRTQLEREASDPGTPDDLEQP